jgi:DNA mismatch repair protein MutS
VAKLAGLPESVIERATEVLKIYENKDSNKVVNVQTQLPLDFNQPSEVEEELKKIDVLNLTPIEAINLLYKLKEKIK